MAYKSQRMKKITSYFHKTDDHSSKGHSCGVFLTFRTAFWLVKGIKRPEDKLKRNRPRARVYANKY